MTLQTYGFVQSQHVMLKRDNNKNSSQGLYFGKNAAVGQCLEADSSSSLVNCLSYHYISQANVFKH